MANLINEAKRMQQLAGLINESQLNEVPKRNMFGFVNERFGDSIRNIGTKIAGGNPAILQKAITDSGIKLNKPIYGTTDINGPARPAAITFKSIDYKTGKVDATISYFQDGKWAESTKGIDDEEIKDIETMFIKIVTAETPEEAQSEADKFTNQIKKHFETGDLSYTMPSTGAQKESIDIDAVVNEALAKVRKK